MHRFRIETGDVRGDQLIIREQEARHLSKVLRLGVGDKITAFDNSGMEYHAVINEVTAEQALCRITAAEAAGKEAPLEVFLLQGLPKADKMELIIQKTTELGIKAIYPIRTSRAVVQLEGKKAVERVQRWQKIAGEAAKQCGRSVVPRVEEIMDLGKALQALPSGTNVFAAYEAEAGQGLKQALANVTQGPVAIVIGPEGGFAPQEITRLQSRGAVSVSLGPRILRTETAGLAALTMVLYDLGDLGSTPK